MNVMLYLAIFLLAIVIVWKILEYLEAAAKKNYAEAQHKFAESYFGEKDAQKLEEFCSRTNSPNNESMRKSRKIVRDALVVIAILILGGWGIYKMHKSWDISKGISEEELDRAERRNRALSHSDSGRENDSVDRPVTIYGYVKSAAVRREIKRISIRGKEWAYNARLMAQTGVSLAQYDLGVCYAMGAPVALDYEKAVSWFRKAAEQGHPGAQYLLGVCYENALGTERDAKQAEYWYGKAAEQDDPDALEALKNLKR